MYDALTSCRPYKPAFPPHEALAEIRNGAGNQFDPALVAHFLEIHAELRRQLDALAQEDFSPRA